jgi:hypothetical protein
MSGRADDPRPRQVTVVWCLAVNPAVRRGLPATPGQLTRLTCRPSHIVTVLTVHRRATRTSTHAREIAYAVAFDPHSCIACCCSVKDEIKIKNKKNKKKTTEYTHAEYVCVHSHAGSGLLTDNGVARNVRGDPCLAVRTQRSPPTDRGVRMPPSVAPLWQDGCVQTSTCRAVRPAHLSPADGWY